MDPVELIIVLFVSLLAHLIITSGALGVTLWYSHREAVSTLKIAQAIQKEVTDAIKEFNKEASIEDRLAGMMEDFVENQKSVMLGYKGDIIKTVEKEIDDAKKDISRAGGGPSLGDQLLVTAIESLHGK